jgi:(1->4)-alpha-D-glucan 1-alpha-D-glucosylmutase
MRVSLASELNVLAWELNRISESDRRTRDFTLNKLREAIGEVVACFPVYRTYIGAEGPGRDDVIHVEAAIAEARRRSTAADTSIFDFVRRVLLVDLPPDAEPAHRAAVLHFAMRFQQYTGPLMAKGLEDTAFYSYNRLLSLN